VCVNPSLVLVLCRRFCIYQVRLCACAPVQIWSRGYGTGSRNDCNLRLTVILRRVDSIMNEKDVKDDTTIQKKTFCRLSSGITREGIHQPNDPRNRSSWIDTKSAVIDRKWMASQSVCLQPCCPYHQRHDAEGTRSRDVTMTSVRRVIPYICRMRARAHTHTHTHTHTDTHAHTHRALADGSG